MKEDKKVITDELKEIGASYLAQVEDKGVRLPERYVQTLQKRVDEQISGLQVPKKEVEEEKRDFKQFWIWGAGGAVAAAVLLIIFLFPKKDVMVTWDDFSNQEIDMIVEENMEDFSDEEWAELTGFSASNMFNATSLDDEYLEEYLMENYEHQILIEDLL